MRPGSPSQLAVSPPHAHAARRTFTASVVIITKTIRAAFCGLLVTRPRAARSASFTRGLRARPRIFR